MDELEVGEHRRGQGDDDDQDDIFAGLEREHHQHDHVPAGGKARKAVIAGLHAGVGKVDDAAEDDGDDHQPARPAGQQPRLEQREGGDEDIGQVIDDQVHQHAVIGRPVALDVIAARQRAIDAVHNQRHDEPEEHQAPFPIHRRQHGQHRQHRPRGGEKVDGKGLDPRSHRTVIKKSACGAKGQARGWAFS
jgi:hypothetical protein